jgi:hypothetical protein
MTGLEKKMSKTAGQSELTAILSTKSPMRHDCRAGIA